MNIKEAKDEIQRAITSYLMKDEFGEYRISRVRQRPILLIGDPGIGKTAIMEQITQELGIGLVSYSMTHHTRQSAIGLPKIETKIYDGKEYMVSEYTMSEIISSVYDFMENTGLKEGILFLDEINCVSRRWRLRCFSSSSTRPSASTKFLKAGLSPPPEILRSTINP